MRIIHAANLPELTYLPCCSLVITFTKVSWKRSSARSWSLTTKRIYENNFRYPDVSLSLLSKCFTFAKFENSDKVTFKHIYEAIKNTNLVYDDVVKKELPVFKERFKEFLEKENVQL
jgi:hypothetical protein